MLKFTINSVDGKTQYFNFESGKPTVVSLSGDSSVYIQPASSSTLEAVQCTYASCRKEIETLHSAVLDFFSVWTVDDGGQKVVCQSTLEQDGGTSAAESDDFNELDVEVGGIVTPKDNSLPTQGKDTVKYQKDKKHNSQSCKDDKGKSATQRKGEQETKKQNKKMSGKKTPRNE
eukprot:Tbor_TRINITY_DN4352_c0_g1::TRINITY_DN4352_c0_g1_i1::g.7807::m.7807